ncbi:Dynamitin-domain-containing protein [Auriculariales sp. MPI-PUGE-AT-0066]|nr:Dynamitin-domain-containing protein [Auriculariales sp. MPI-PUGE-AT-0066]
MSSGKYANLPDIDTAPDVYETADVVSGADADIAYSDDEDVMHSSKARRSAGPGAAVNPEEVDTNSFMNPNDAVAHFRQAEKRGRTKALYTYPPSPSSEEPTNQAPLGQRIQQLRAELAELEAEAAQPASTEAADADTKAGEIIRELVDMRGRLERLNNRKGRERLIELLTSPSNGVQTRASTGDDSQVAVAATLPKPDSMSALADVDKRVGQLEKLVGSSSAALDDTSQLPPPLVPQITRLSAQLTLLTQPRHIDSVSRRLKLLLADLERTSGAGAGQAASRRQPSQVNGAAPAPVQPTLQADLLPILTRLSPHLPTLPHILARLRTLSALHTSAAAFETTLKDLEDEQKKVRAGLGELSSAVDRVEKTLSENETMTAQNVQGLEQRIDGLVQRLEALSQ